MIAPARIIAHPVVAASIAVVVILIAAALGASHVTVTANGIPLSENVEHVVVKKMEIAQAPARAYVPAPAPAPGAAPQIARTGKISMYVQNVDKAAAALSLLARANGGDVFSSDIASGDGSVSEPSGQMEIRVPAERFDAALDGVARTGNVRERSTNAQDLTGDITDSDARLRNLRQTEADIRHIMDRSGSVSQIMDAENQLSQVREQIETLESDLKSMRGRVAYATIEIDLQAEASAAPVQPTFASQLVSAWHGATAALAQLTVGILALGLWLVAFSPYLLAAAAVAWFVLVQLRKTRLRA
jgi:hypothetical protein